ncbi:MaoC family dehydratase [Beggiatoa leptomitoformis]|uniref:(R)-hydratase n=1 Tax=Beggiatoa leptomitoformis TaxID=288004 RepID=A0A2N9YBH0_9GAMM|nr:MaoC family dehydratase [Beggiatoa leptomitoformis]ALG66821.1 (R)-hydratase [Beggiatoa leptomitoformis]AUI67828.1 (R)-hydratase [Beggiatoa leptomitoformis]
MSDLHGYYIEDIEVGMKASYAKTVTETDVVLFAGISGDNNPVHINQEFAEQTPFKSRIAHGMLSVGFISMVLGTRLPGPGAIYISQTVKFKAPVHIGDTVHAEVTVKEVIKEKRRVILETICRVKETVVIDGEAMVMVDSKAS